MTGKERSSMGTESVDTQSPDESRQIHELQVYKIELEMQNDELRRVQEQLEAERSRAEERSLRLESLANEQRIILNNMPLGVCFLKDRKILTANPAFERILGYEVGETLGKNTSAIYPDIETYERVGKEAYEAIANGGIHVVESLM